uniref:putative oxidoreductase TDA3 n=1 Tax=Erigeron canadensis TaxID=72917 RepID=UPI001CB99F37|nr:putative oxidoreductase TDA3 [Erigeron canadensis]
MGDNGSQHEPPKRVVVCGGGIIGVCTAYYLAKKGAKVILIERSAIAGAASGKAGAFLARYMCDGGPLSSLARTSFDLHGSLAKELDGARSYGYQPFTTFTLVSNESDQPSKGSSLPSWIDGPFKQGEITGTTETTAQIHPRLFTCALLAKAVKEYGVEVVIAKVESVAVEDQKVAVKLDRGGVIGGDAVVLALGPWTSKLPGISSKFRVYGKKANSIVLESKDSDIITTDVPVSTYYPEIGFPNFFLRPTGEVYICGPFPVDAEVPDSPELVFPDPEVMQMLKRAAGIVSSHLAENSVTVKNEQAGLLPATDDELPIMGEIPGMKNCYVSTGHCYWGILFAPVSGVAMAELVIDGQASIVDLSCFSPNRFAGKDK